MALRCNGESSFHERVPVGGEAGSVRLAVHFKPAMETNPTSTPAHLSSSGRPLRVGLVFETFDTYARESGDPSDAQAEYEPWATVELLEEALGRLGHETIRMGSPHALLASLSESRPPAVDVALNIAEGFGGRNREAWAPVLLEMAGIPCLGSDALTLSLSLDKAWANDRARSVGIPVAPQCVLASADEAEKADLPAAFPLFVKPRGEGSAKGIRLSSRVEGRAALVAEVRRVVADYAQPALVEAFLPGAEYTVMVTGHDPCRVWPVLQRALESSSRIGLHALGHESSRDWDHVTPGELTAELEANLKAAAAVVFEAFECRDFARIDFRMDATGKATFLELNPLPTFAPDGTFGVLAELEGRPVTALLAEVLEQALHRVGFQQAERPVRGNGD